MTNNRYLTNLSNKKAPAFAGALNLYRLTLTLIKDFLLTL